MLARLGFTYVPTEAVMWAVIAMGMAALFAGWIVDAVMKNHAFGWPGNVVVLWVGAIGSTVLWNLYGPTRVVTTDPVKMVMIVTGGSFALLTVLVILMAIVRR